MLKIIAIYALIAILFRVVMYFLVWNKRIEDDKFGKNVLIFDGIVLFWPFVLFIVIPYGFYDKHREEKITRKIQLNKDNKNRFNHVLVKLNLSNNRWGIIR